MSGAAHRRLIAAVAGVLLIGALGCGPVAAQQPGDAAKSAKKEKKTESDKKALSASAAGHAKNRRQDRDDIAHMIGGANRNAAGVALHDPALAPAGVKTASIPPASVAAPGPLVTPHPPPARLTTGHTTVMTMVPIHGVNGTGLVRPGAGPAVVGGSANKSASISGTGLRRKR